MSSIRHPSKQETAIDCFAYGMTAGPHVWTLDLARRVHGEEGMEVGGHALQAHHHLTCLPNRTQYLSCSSSTTDHELSPQGWICTQFRIQFMTYLLTSLVQRIKHEQRRSDLLASTTRGKKRMECGESQHYHHANDIDVTVDSLDAFDFEDRMIIFGMHAERRDGTLPRSWRMREARREMDVHGGSQTFCRPTMTTKHTLSIHLLISWSRLSIDEKTWFSGVGTRVITQSKCCTFAVGTLGGEEGVCVRVQCGGLARMYAKGTVRERQQTRENMQTGETDDEEEFYWMWQVSQSAKGVRI
ncbi:hypothetical protein ARMGADRAFT_1037200 [Armillaria gallica]|uniref:Uncharacterized protein n=1 Tax=Armillaria gallica TaxID=47427 RepID=A0A2H3CYK6_ARMGA|nr:hypothetical protein ARMGADRAFT_1037200 [Armillaria gallica]